MLVIDDDPQIVRALRINLAAHGYHVTVAVDGAAALRLAADRHPDVVILDLGLPDLDGTEVIAGLRGWTSVPIIVLSARVDSADKVRALDAGADDYMTKPFGMAELLARLRAAVRRAATDVGENQGVVDLGSIRIDLAAKLVRRGGSDVHLTPTEWGILEVLLKHRGKLVTQRELLRTVWGPKYDGRRQLPAGIYRATAPQDGGQPARPKHLITEAGMGYRFERSTGVLRPAPTTVHHTCCTQCRSSDVFGDDRLPLASIVPPFGYPG